MMFPFSIFWQFSVAFLRQVVNMLIDEGKLKGLKERGGKKKEIEELQKGLSDKRDAL